MDPYLETPEFWPDFHARFVNYWCEAVAAQLPDHYEARIDERVSLVELAAERDELPARVKNVLPDVAITRLPDAPLTRSMSGAATILEPVAIPLIVAEDEIRETYIEILHRPERSLVAVLELLSPTNKIDVGYGEYVKKRIALLRQPIHLVELDLLIGGQRLPTARPLPPGDYYALVARSERRPYADVYAWTIRDRLPKIPIPLKAPDADLHVELAAVFDTAFERGRYARSLRYHTAPEVTLSAEDRQWCLELARAGQ